MSHAPPREAHNTARRPPAALPAHFQPAEVLAQALEALEPALEVLDTVDENLCTPAKPLIIVKTLNRTRANKGFYYDEKLCKLSEKLVDPAKTLEPGRIALEPRLEPDAGGREAFRAQHENTARPAAGTITPDPDVLCRWLPGPAQTRKPEPAPTPDCKPP